MLITRMLRGSRMCTRRSGSQQGRSTAPAAARRLFWRWSRSRSTRRSASGTCCLDLAPAISHPKNTERKQTEKLQKPEAASERSPSALHAATCMHRSQQALGAVSSKQQRKGQVGALSEANRPHARACTAQPKWHQVSGYSAAPLKQAAQRGQPALPQCMRAPHCSRRMPNTPCTCVQCWTLSAAAVHGRLSSCAGPVEAGLAWPWCSSREHA